MPRGEGKYHKELVEALVSCGAMQGMLIILDGKEGPSFCVAGTEELNKRIPELLRLTADVIEKEQASDV